MSDDRQRDEELVRRRWLERLGRPADLDFPFFAVEEDYPRGPTVTVVAGELGTGAVRAGDELEAVGLAPAPFPVRVAAVERPLAERGGVERIAAGAAGEVLGLTLEHTAEHRPVAGQCLAPAGRLALASRVEAEVWVLPADSTPGSSYEHRLMLEAVEAGRGLELFFHTRAVVARAEGAWQPRLGAEYRAAFRLERPVALYPGTRFALRYEGLVFGAGFVVDSAG
jgi:translation elongation factor EF-Tu-like GTPase